MSLTKSPNMTILKNLRSKIFKSRYSGWDKGRKLESPFVKYRGTTLECNIWF